MRGWAERFEHLVRPRWLGLTGGRAINALNGVLILLAVLLLMAPLPLIPFVNSMPALAVILLCFGMAERDGGVIALGYFVTLVSTVYVGGLIFLVFYAGLRHEQVLADAPAGSWWAKLLRRLAGVSLLGVDLGERAPSRRRPSRAQSGCRPGARRSSGSSRSSNQ